MNNPLRQLIATSSEPGNFGSFLLRRWIQAVDELWHEDACHQATLHGEAGCRCNEQQLWVFYATTARRIIADATAHGIDVAAACYDGFTVDTEGNIGSISRKAQIWPNTARARTRD